MMPILSFVLAYAVIVISPGPNLAVVLQAGLTRSRRHAMLTAAGVATGAAGLGGTVFALSQVMAPGTAPAQAMALLYGPFLIWSGLGSLRRTAARSEVAGAGGFLRGCLTAAGNPLSALFFIASAEAIRPASAQLPLIVALIAVTVAGWFGLAAFCITSPRLRGLHRLLLVGADPVLGCVLIGFGGLALVRAILDALG